MFSLNIFCSFGTFKKIVTMGKWFQDLLEDEASASSDDDVNGTC